MFLTGTFPEAMGVFQTSRVTLRKKTMIELNNPNVNVMFETSPLFIISTYIYIYNTNINMCMYMMDVYICI